MIAPSALVEVQRDAVLVGTSGFFGLVAMEVSCLSCGTFQQRRCELPH